MPKTIDLTGQRFGLLTVLCYTQNKPSPSGKRTYRYYWCICVCGRNIEVKGENLTQGNRVACGCTKAMISQAHTLTDANILENQRFGMCVVIKRDFKNLGRFGYENARFIIKCDCGKEKSVLGKELKRGKIKNCGCLKRKWQQNGFKEKFCQKKNYLLIKEKICNKCQVLKNIDEFCKSYHRYHGTCKTCKGKNRRTGFIKIKKCLNCHIEFKVTAPCQKYCGLECKKSYHCKEIS